MGSDSDIRWGVEDKPQSERFRESAKIEANRITVKAAGGEVTPKRTKRGWAEHQKPSGRSRRRRAP
jgi:hypothetical protein